MSGTENSERERESTGRSPRLRREALRQAEVPPCPNCGEPRFSCLPNTRRCCKCDISSGHSWIVGGSNPSKKPPEIDLVLRLGPDPEIAEEEKEAVVKSDEKTGAVKGRNSGSTSVNPVSAPLTKMPTVNPVTSSTEADRARMKTIIEAAQKQDPQDDSGLRERVMEALHAEKFRCPHCNADDTVFLRDFNNNTLDRPRYRCRKCPRPKQRFTVGATLRGSRSSRLSRGADQAEEKLQLLAADERNKPSPSLGRRHRGSRRSGLVIKETEEQNKSPATSSSSSSTSSGKSGSQPRKLRKGDEPAVMPLKESARMNIIESAVTNAANASSGEKPIASGPGTVTEEAFEGPGTVTDEAFEGADQTILCPACGQGEAKFDYFNDGQARYYCKRCKEEWTVLDGESAVRGEEGVEAVKLTEFGFFS